MILWSAFTIFIVVYIVIADNVLANPNYARGLWFAETARMIQKKTSVAPTTATPDSRHDQTAMQ